MPSPDLDPLEERLVELKRNIYKSLPNSRLTSKTDSPAYSRAAIHVLAFKVRVNIFFICYLLWLTFKSWGCQTKWTEDFYLIENRLKLYITTIKCEIIVFKSVLRNFET